MGYEIQISEVGAAEYPLMAVLRETILRECGIENLPSLEADLEGRADVHAVIAHLEGNPLGYKIGYRHGPGVYYSKAGGVFKEYRGLGLARRMQQMQHDFARSRGYRTVFFNTFNQFKPMMRLALSGGFIPGGIEKEPGDHLKIEFVKDLTRDQEPHNGQEAPAEGEIHIESVGPNFHGLVADLSSKAGEIVSEEEIDREFAGARDGLAVVAFVGGKAAGCATGAGADGRKLHWVCRRIGVAPNWRGRGVEAALLRHVGDAARSIGYAAVRQHARQEDVPTLLAAIESDYDFVGMLTDPGAGTVFLLDGRLGKSRVSI